MAEMKDSGIAWIGEIPSGWKVQKIKYIANNEKDSFIDGDWIESPFITDSGIRYLTSGNIGDGNYKDQGNGFISEETFRKLNCKFAYSGDLVISRLNAPYGRSCMLPDDFDRYVIAVDNVILRTDESKGYICYVTQCNGYQASVLDKAAGTTMKRISRTNLGNVFIPLPPLSMQKAITSFLDSKCAEIDCLSADIQKQIDTLVEYKKSVITEAVTKGLDPDVEMKESGVNWGGRIPYNWTVKKAKYCVVISNGSDPVMDGDIPVYGSGATSFKTCGEYKTGPAVLIGRKGATLHIPHYIDGLYWNVDTAFDVKAKVGYSLRYYYYLATIFDYKYYISQTTLPSMTQTNYYNMNLPCPALEVQLAIVNHLDSKCAEIDTAIDLKKKQLTTLDDYKKSLIYEYVTGKKEVPNE